MTTLNLGQIETSLRYKMRDREDLSALCREYMPRMIEELDRLSAVELDYLGLRLHVHEAQKALENKCYNAASAILSTAIKRGHEKLAWEPETEDEDEF